MIPLRVHVTVFFWLLASGFCHAATNVACVGDSITAGVGVGDPTVDSYPAKLQKLLGTNYVVKNFGVSGTTLLLQGDMPYLNTSAYPASRSSPTPDIVIIMLGSNDSKPQNWVYGTNFSKNYKSIIASYTNLVTSPRVLICTPPPCFGPNGPLIDPDILATNISPLVRQLGTNLNHQVIDMQLLLAGHGEWFPDNVHPNSPGTSVMAAIVYTAIRGDALDGSIPGLGIATSANNQNAILNWPAGGAGWVVQTTPVLSDTNIWTIGTNIIFNNATATLVTNPIAGTSSMFRLWNPSIQNN
jgi:acyl-CoA thioesterase I